MTDAGFAVLVFDYRGSGDPGGDRGVLSPNRQLQDLVNTVSYLTTRDDVVADAMGTSGPPGRTGGGTVLLTGVALRVKAAVSQAPVADGADWLHRMGQAFLASLQGTAGCA